MRFQRTKYSCGPVAIVNAARVFGDKLTEKAVSAHTGTTKKDGTGAFGIHQGLERIGYKFTEHSFVSREEAWSALHDSLTEGSPVILSADVHSHWVVAVGLVGERVILIDSEQVPRNKKENGVWVLTQGQLFKRWTKSQDTYYGISVQK